MTSHSRHNPYVGPRAFEADDTLYGRDQEVRDLLNLLIAERIVLLDSPSGAGKTSLIQAALIPALRDEGFQVLPVIRVGSELPPDPDLPPAINRYLLSTLLSLEEGFPTEQQIPLPELAGMELATYLDQRQPDGVETDGEVLIFDQFEELLTLDHTDQAAKTEFFVQLGKTLRHRYRWALFAMREEYSSSLAPYVRPVPTRLSATFRLELLEKDAASQAIRKPANQEGVRFHDAAAAKLIDDLRQVRVQQPDGTTKEQSGPYIEPVQLQVVCHRLWRDLPDGMAEIREADVLESGDVDSALAAYYAERVQSTAEESGVPERTIREWFEHHLITEQEIRGQVLRGAEHSQGLENRAIESLVSTHLVRAENRRGATWYELAHDRLIKPVKNNNAAWREEHLSPLQHQSALWNRQNRSDGLLFRDEALKEAERWATDHPDALTDTDREFLTACQEEQAIAERERQQNRRIRRLAIVSTLGFIIAILAFFGAFYFFRHARDEATRARKAEATATSRELAAAAISNLEVDPERSILLAMHALSVHQTPEAENALYQALQTSRVEFTFSDHNANLKVNSVSFSPDGIHLATAGNDGAVRVWNAISGKELSTLEIGANAYEVIFSPDGKRLAMANEDKTVKIWNALSGEKISTIRVEAKVYTVTFSPDGTRLAIASADKTAKVWDAASSQLVHTFSGHQAEVHDVAFSPDGYQIATASKDGTAKIWNTLSGEELSTIEIGAPLYSLDFSPDGTRLAISGKQISPGPDIRTQIWDISELASPHLALTLSGHTNTVFDVMFRPDGKRVATAGWDRTAKVWDAGSGQILLTLFGHTYGIIDIAFSPDGERLATASWDGTAKVWNVTAIHSGLSTLFGHTAQITHLAFNSDGTRLATASDDGTAIVWDTTSGKKLFTAQIGSQVTDAAISPDGKYLVTAGRDKMASVWDTASGEKLRTLPDQADSDTVGWVNEVAFSPDGKYLATAHFDGTVAVWEMSSGMKSRTLSGHTAWVYKLRFSPNGEQLATASLDKTARVWEMSSGQSFILSEHSGHVYGVDFSPDGRLLALAGEEREITVWDIASRQILYSLFGHTDRVYSVVFSPNGKRLATASADKKVKVWNLPDLASEQKWAVEALNLFHEGVVYDVSFSPDGRYLATAGQEGIVRLYTLNIEELMLVAQDRVTRSLKLEECQKYLHQKQCPSTP